MWAIVLLLVTQCSMSGCAGRSRASLTEAPSAPAMVTYPGDDAQAIPGEIDRLEAELAATDDSGRSETLVRLAMLYTHHANPQPDYNRAFECMAAYAEQRDAVDARYVMALLETLSSGQPDRNQRDCDRLEKDFNALKAGYERLEAENRLHREMIEKLKHLDLQLEKRRERIK